MNTHLVYCMQYVPYTPGLYTVVTFKSNSKASKRNAGLRSMHVLRNTNKRLSVGLHVIYMNLATRVNDLISTHGGKKDAYKFLSSVCKVAS
jgi:hypothetical protein